MIDQISKKACPCGGQSSRLILKKEIWGWFNSWLLFFFTFIFVIESLVVHINESTLSNPAKRAFVGAVMNGAAYVHSFLSSPFQLKINHSVIKTTPFVASWPLFPASSLLPVPILKLKLNDGFFQSAQIEVPLREDDIAESIYYIEKG